jgi:hypothetical protein
MKRIDVSTPKYPNTFALVDDADYERLNQWKWTATDNNGTVYPQRNFRVGITRCPIRMHQDIMGIERDCMVDHKDGNGLNNTRDNLRKCTRSQNGMNRCINKNSFSGFKGVTRDNPANKWRARISVKGMQIFLGNYFCVIKAARAYDEAAVKYHGDFANTNFKAACLCKIERTE